MSWIASVMTVMALSVTVYGGDSAAAPGGTVAEQLKPFLPLVKQSRDYQGLLRGVRWEDVYSEEFAPNSARKWTNLTPIATIIENGSARQIQTSRFDKVNGHDVLVFDVTHLNGMTGGRGVLTIGPKVSGEFAFEFVGQLVSPEVCDLSIFCDAVEEGPGFQFGAYWNTRNVLWTSLPDAGKLRAQGQKVVKNVECGHSPLINRDQWYTVRFEIFDGNERGFVDGKLIGQTPIDPKAWNADQEFQPLFYTFAATARLRSARTQRCIREKPLDKVTAWKKAFGDQTEADIRTKVDSLIDLLADEDQNVRDQAQDLLNRLGEIAVPSLQAAVANGSPEQQQRASGLLEIIKPSTMPTVDAPADSTK